jgi:hypothetical protein
VPPYLYKGDDNPEGGLDEAMNPAVSKMVCAATASRSLTNSITNFSVAGERSDLSVSNRLYHREIAEFASPKGTLDCIAAFSYTDFATTSPRSTYRRWSYTATPMRSSVRGKR